MEITRIDPLNIPSAIPLYDPDPDPNNDEDVLTVTNSRNIVSAENDENEFSETLDATERIQIGEDVDELENEGEDVNDRSDNQELDSDSDDSDIDTTTRGSKNLRGRTVRFDL